MAGAAISSGNNRIGSSLYVFPTDLHDEGVEAVLENIQQRASVDAISIAVAYHAARDVLPHGIGRKIQYYTEGELQIRPKIGLYDGLRIQPKVTPLAEETDIFVTTLVEAEARGMGVNAWTVFLHLDRPGAYAECSPENAFGDRYLTDLCPAHPDVRAYVRALATDAARPGVATVMAESLHFHLLEHGFHHERYLVELGASGRYLLGLCFCRDCLTAAREHGVDVERVRRDVREILEHLFVAETDLETCELNSEDVGMLAGGELGGYLDARVRTVTSLVAETAEVVGAAGSRLCFIDLSGGVKGYATGKPTGGAAASIGWQCGIDVVQLAAVCDEIEVVGYAADTARLKFDLDAYLYAGCEPSELTLALRPSPPDTASAANLKDKIDLAQAFGIGRIDFYHYGLVRLSALDWIKEAIAP